MHGRSILDLLEVAEEYGGRYAPVVPDAHSEGIENEDFENSPYYVNLEMNAFFRAILKNTNSN